jgi:NAD(P)-dependent dehydrogenase (short-subunit alcohol dehydrogenase family)
MPSFEVKGRISIVTGSAQGFGKEFAKRLLQNGAKVCLSDVNESVGEETLSKFQTMFGKENVTFKK